MKAPRILTDIPGRIFAVGDIHGCVAELMVLLEALEREQSLSSDDTVVFTGDYIDRGPSSREVIETLIAFRRRFPRVLFLKGNHEDMMLSFLGIVSSPSGPLWLRNGGDEVLRSYGALGKEPSEIIDLLPTDHRDFLTSLDRYIVTDRFIFVHAGLHPLKDLLVQADEDILWIRKEFIQNIHRFNKTIVFGHTPFGEVFLHLPYKVGIDTGLVFGNKITALEVLSGQVIQVAAGKRKALTRTISL